MIMTSSAPRSSLELESGSGRGRGLTGQIMVAAIAGQYMRAGTRSPNITGNTPIDVSTVFWHESDQHVINSVQPLHIILDNNGRDMVSVTHLSGTWMKHVQLSNNCHTQNIQIVTGDDGNLFLESSRDIRPEEPLYAWFSPETAKIFNIPFLSLQNIKGDRDYSCHQCQVHYQNPNPLKIHLAFFCHQVRLSPPPCPLIRCYPIIQLTPFLHPIAHESIATSPTLRKITSATSPIHQVTSSGTSLSSSTDVELEGTSTRTSSSSNSRGRHGGAHNKHKCPYCGKLYSRKYGLKIHVRTHTGYKPLQCKVCTRKFGDPSNLNKHVRLHAQGTTPYRCHLCGKVLVRRRDLDRHLKSRHPK